VFRVRVTGSPEVCARRLSEQSGIDLREAQRRVQETDEARATFIHTHFRQSVREPERYDLVVNTDRLEFAAVARVILFAMHQAGYPVPQQAWA
jgi:cytidylate kinase